MPAKQRMTPRHAHLAPLGPQRRAAGGQLLLQVLPLMGELACTDGNGIDRADRPELGSIERVAATGRFFMDGGQVRIDRQAGLGMCLEAFQLGVARVATRIAAQYGPGQQCLAPQRHQALGVEIHRVQ